METTIDRQRVSASPDEPEIPLRNDDLAAGQRDPTARQMREIDGIAARRAEDGAAKTSRSVVVAVGDSDGRCRCRVGMADGHGHQKGRSDTGQVSA